MGRNGGMKPKSGSFDSSGSPAPSHIRESIHFLGVNRRYLMATAISTPRILDFARVADASLSGAWLSSRSRRIAVNRRRNLIRYFGHRACRYNELRRRSAFNQLAGSQAYEPGGRDLHTSNYDHGA